MLSIKPVSFGSTYKINYKNLMDKQEQKKFNMVTSYCFNNRFKCFEESNNNDDMSITSTVITPDKNDKNTENFFKHYNIDFIKLKTKDLMSPKNIENRVEEAPEGFKLVKVNSKELEKLSSSQDANNIKICENLYNKFFMKKIKNMIKSGNKLSATQLKITPMEGKNWTLNFIKEWGVNSLHQDCLEIKFKQRTDKPDNFMYFAMKDLGMKTIPMYVDEESYELGKALNLFE